MSKIILTGDRPTGRLHAGHYVGSLRQRVQLQNSGAYDKVYIMIADAQALTDNAEHPEKVRKNIIEVALDYLACGLDPAKSTLFIQSMVPQLTELTFYYMNLVTVSRLQRNPTVKNEIKMRNFEASIPTGFFCYPISQAADITAFRKKNSLNQAEFWGLLGITQSGGSRYESGRKIPKPVMALVVLRMGTKPQKRATLRALDIAPLIVDAVNDVAGDVQGEA